MSVGYQNPQGPFAVAVAAQVASSTPNSLIQEVVRSDISWRDDVVIWRVRIEGIIGYRSSAPGIGIEVNET